MEFDTQCAKKVMSVSLELVDFAIRLVNSVLARRASEVFEKLKLQKNCNQCYLSQNVLGLLKRLLG